MKNRLLNICILCMVFPFFLQAADTHSVYNLRCEQEENPLGIETGQPCFSWQIQAQQRNFEQSAWQILVADSPETTGRQWKYLGQRKNAFFRLDPCSFQRKRIESRTDLLLESKELG